MHQHAVCCQLWFLNESNFFKIGSVCFSAQRMQVFSALPRGNTNNHCIPLWHNLFWTNLLYRFGVLEAVVLVLIALISAAQRPYQKQGIIFLAIQNVKQCPSQTGGALSMSWRLQGGCNGAKVWCSKALPHRHSSDWWPSGDWRLGFLALWHAPTFPVTPSITSAHL